MNHGDIPGGVQAPLGGGKHNKASVIEQIPMGGYIISIFAKILGSLR